MHILLLYEVLVVKRTSLTSAGEKSAIANNAHILNNVQQFMSDLWVWLALMLKCISLLGALFVVRHTISSCGVTSACA